LEDRFTKARPGVRRFEQAKVNRASERKLRSTISASQQHLSANHPIALFRVAAALH
jgi:hypothetical protein